MRRPMLAVLALLAALPALGAPGELRVLRPPGGVGSIALLPTLSGDCRIAAFPHAGQIVLLDRADGTDRLASVSPTGKPGDGDSSWPALSDDGRFIAFSSYAANLVDEPRASRFHGFVRDLQTATTVRLEDVGGVPALSGDGGTVVYSSAPSSAPRGSGPRQLVAYDVGSGRAEPVALPGAGLPDGGSLTPALGHRGRFVAFASAATNLVPGDRGGHLDVFVLDRSTGLVERISRTAEGRGGSGPSDHPSLDAGGRLVAFASDAPDLVAGDRGGWRDVFVHERATGKNELVSVSSTGVPGDGSSDLPALSRDGRFVAFVSRAANLVPGDANAVADVFVRDRERGETFRASVSPSDQGGDDESGTNGVVWSADGRCLAFQSWASNLLPGQPRGENVFIRELRRPPWRSEPAVNP